MLISTLRTLALALAAASLPAGVAALPPGGPNPLTNEQAAQAIVAVVVAQEAGVESLNAHGNFIGPYQAVLRERFWEFSCETQDQPLVIYRRDGQNPSARYDVASINISDAVKFPARADFVRICLEDPSHRLSGLYEDTYNYALKDRHFVVAAQIDHLPFESCSLQPQPANAFWLLMYTQYWPSPVAGAGGAKVFLMSRRPGDDNDCLVL